MNATKTGEKLKSKRTYWIIAIVLALIVLSFGFIRFQSLRTMQLIADAVEKSSSSSSLPDIRTSYIIPVPGEVVIHFKTTLSLDDIGVFLKQNNLQAIPGSITQNLILESRSDDAEQQLQKDIDQLKASNVLVSCQPIRHLLNSYPDTFCQPNTKIPLEKLEYRSLDRQLFVVPSDTALATIVVRVPVGQENSLVAKLIQQPEILDAIAPK